MLLHALFQWTQQFILFLQRIRTEHMDEFESASEADAFVLAKSVEGLLRLVEAQAKCYNEARDAIATRRTARAFAADEVADIAPDCDAPGLAKLRSDLCRLRCAIVQMSRERDSAKAQSDSVIRQLREENAELRAEVQRLTERGGV